jgi:ATP-dependent Clp protease ATP-binding subunit ClpB
MDFDKYTERSKGFLQAAQALAQRRGNQQIAPEHLLKVLLDDKEGLASNLISAAQGDPNRVRAAVDAALDKLPRVEGSGAGKVYLAPETNRLFTEAVRVAENAGDRFVTVERMPASPRRISTMPSRRSARAGAPIAPVQKRAMTRSRNMRATSPRRRVRASSTR